MGLSQKKVKLNFPLHFILGDFKFFICQLLCDISFPYLFKKNNTFDIFATFVGQLFQEDLVAFKKAGGLCRRRRKGKEESAAPVEAEDEDDGCVYSVT